MPFKEIDVDKLIEDKIENNPELKDEFKLIEAELDVIAQIIQARKKKGLSQKEVADRAGVTQQVVSRIENKEHSPNLRNLVKVTNALGLKLKVVSK